ncbi:MAG: LysR family transcriptional regulator [Acidobacteriaceae bacterium]|nr:LysR family transcriptional regulator [Acidobacteriaceae bacterium]
MELRHLQYFVTVATTGGFGRAARALHVSQSAISEQVRDLEHEIGVDLIDRSQRQIRLTVEGELFLEGARKTLATAEQAVQTVQRAKRGEEGNLTIGFFVGGHGRYFPRLIRAFRKQYPRVKVSLIEMTPAQQWTAIASGTLDIGFTRSGSGSNSEGVKTERFLTERMYVALSKDNPLSKRRDLSIAELHDESFVMADRGTSPMFFDRILTMCSEAGFSPKIQATATVSSGVIALVEAGEGVAVVAEGARLFGSSEVVFVPLQGAAAFMEIVMAWPSQRAGGVHRSFLELARKFRAQV